MEPVDREAYLSFIKYLVQQEGRLISDPLALNVKSFFRR